MRSAIGLFILFLVFSCKKEEPKPPYIPPHGPSSSNYSMVQDLRKWKFKVNSYWVYEDLISLQTDSVYIDLITMNGFIPVGYNNYEAYAYRLRHSVTSDTDYMYVGSGAVNRGPFLEDPRRSFVYVVYNSQGNAYYPQDSVFRSDSVFIYDRYYKEVVSIHLQGEKYEDSLKTNYYSNSDFGLLRKDVFNTNGTLKHKWLLKNKNVIR